ncbi:hypothetical protein [Cellvibrio sp. UBA7671]|uniref:hypothetical protein n=1 Tax=Cellvibrio sp. UBA7671 TaxID=1946312 RepID=UPI002F35996F
MKNGDLINSILLLIVVFAVQQIPAVVSWSTAYLEGKFFLSFIYMILPVLFSATHFVGKIYIDIVDRKYEEHAMSKFSDQVMAMTPRELENGDWRIVMNALIEAKERFAHLDLGNQSWLDAPIAIAKERSTTVDPVFTKSNLC